MKKSDVNLSVIMPCYNEGKNIYLNLLKTIDIIEKFETNFEIICVDDGSIDNSKNEIKKAEKKNKKIKCISYLQNKGKGNALKVGTAVASGKLIAFVDSDLELSPAFLERYISIMKENNSDVVIGSKMHKDSVINYPLARKILSIGYFVILKMLFNLKIKDTQTGLKLFKRQAVKEAMGQIETNGFAFDIELLVMLHQGGYKIVDAPVELEFTREKAMGKIKVRDIFKMANDTFNIFVKTRIKNNYMKGWRYMNEIYFFIGTEAELMKMYSTILEAKNRGYQVKIVSSGQNIITNSPFLKLINEKIEIDLSRFAPKKKGAKYYLQWFFKTRRLGIKILKEELKYKDKSKNLMVVHGDTLSTLMGSMISKKVKLKYVHVESGFRSYNWFSPFPEEIDRYFSSKGSIMNFCQKKEAYEYAKNAFKGKAVNLHYNTGIETLYYALDECQKKGLKSPLKEKYFVFALHRQENLYNSSFMKNVVEEIIKLSKKMSCVFIYHVQTQEAMKKLGLWNKIVAANNITTIGRQEYVDFINIINHCEFIIGDGCGNQQEFYYLGKPYLIMRTKVEENTEGLNWNAKPFENDFSNISKFYDEYKDFIHSRVKMEKKPSQIIMEHIDSFFEKKES